MKTAMTLVFAVTLSSVVAADDSDKKKPEDEKKADSVYAFQMKPLEGDEEIDLSEYQGQVLLIVNVASRCGATPQYAQLEELHEKYADKGLTVMGFPCNQFGRQEPGDAKQIREFCDKTYGVKFAMFDKIDVNGKERAGLYEYLTAEDTYPDDPGDIKWNFEKFVVNREGKVVGRFRTRTAPDDDEVIELLETELAKDAPKAEGKKETTEK